MIQRSVALYDGSYIGIESVYTVINGKQINIQSKVEEVRELGRANKLFCECGCGNNLALVAGERNLREQHFRIKRGSARKCECTALTEGQVSTDSRVVLKCWLEDKLNADDIETRVPIDVVEETKRKPEFTALSRSQKMGLRYWKTGANIIEDRLDVLHGNLSGIRVFYVVDESSRPVEGQYPETSMKIQERQGYCLLLSVQDRDYEHADMRAVFYAKDIDGLWRENCLVKGKLKDFDISEALSITYHGTSLEDMLASERLDFEKCQEAEAVRREEHERRRLEKERRAREAAEIERLEWKKERQRFEEQLLEKRRLVEAETKRRNEEKRKRQLEERLQQKQEYLERHPGTAAVFHYLSGLKKFSGKFIHNQIDGSKNSYIIEVTDEKPIINAERSRIEFPNNKVCFYVEETAANYNTKGCPYSYMIVKTLGKDKEQIEKYLEDILRVVKNTASKCADDGGNCQSKKDGNCLYEGYCMFQQYG